MSKEGDAGRDPGTGDDSEDLAKRAAARDGAAWGELFERHYMSVYSFLRYRLRGADEAEDIAANVFEVAYANVHRFDYRGVPIQAWLFGIARNLARDHIKKQQRRGYHEEITEAMTPAEEPETAAIDMRQDLAAAMGSLTEDQQTVLSLRFLLDKSVTETAALMDRSEDAVKNLQRRALGAMHRALEAAGYERASP